MSGDKGTMDAAALIAAVREEWTTNLRRQKQLAAVDGAFKKCMQCHRDQAEGRISQEQNEQWLRDRGEPALQAAKVELLKIEREIYAGIVTPMVTKFMRERTERQLSLLAEVIAINAEKTDVEQALREVKLGRPSCVISDLTDVWLAEERQRVERALAPQQPVAVYRPPARQPEPDYDPLVVALGQIATLY